MAHSVKLQNGPYESMPFRIRGYSYGESDGNEGKRGESETKQEKVGAKRKTEKQEKKKRRRRRRRRKGGRERQDKSTISGSFLQNLNTKRRGGKPPRYKDRLIPFPTLSALNDHLSLPKESRRNTPTMGTSRRFNC